MNKTMKIAIPVVAGVVAAATGIGIAAARSGNQNTTYTPTSYDTIGTTPISDGDAQSQYCGGAGMMGSGMGMGLQVTTARVATLLGATTADLKAQLETGKTLADIAKARGVSNDTLIQTILAPFQEHLDIMVKYGYMTKDQAAAMADQAKKMAESITTSNLQDLTRGSLGYNGMMGSGGMMGGSGGMMDGWGSSLQQQGTATPRTGFGGMMGGSGGMMGGW